MVTDNAQALHLALTTGPTRDGGRGPGHRGVRLTLSVSGGPRSLRPGTYAVGKDAVPPYRWIAASEVDNTGLSSPNNVGQVQIDSIAPMAGGGRARVSGRIWVCLRAVDARQRRSPKDWLAGRFEAELDAKLETRRRAQSLTLRPNEIRFPAPLTSASAHQKP